MHSVFFFSFFFFYLFHLLDLVHTWVLVLGLVLGSWFSSIETDASAWDYDRFGLSVEFFFLSPFFLS